MCCSTGSFAGCLDEEMHTMYVFADGGDPGNPPFCPPTVEVRPNKILSIKNGDLHVPLIHMSNT